MSGIKTLATETPVSDYLAGLSDAMRRSEAEELVKIFHSATKMQPRIWGTSIVGYGSYHYKSERSRQEGDWPLTGFSMRKGAISVYIMPGFADYGDLLAKLGKYKTSVGCLYIKKLNDIDHKALRELIVRVVHDMKKRYPDSNTT